MWPLPMLAGYGLFNESHPLFGGMIVSEDVYAGLRAFLDAMPGGFPATNTGIEIKILKKLYSPDEAELTMKLKEDPEQVSEIANRIGMKERELAEKLKDMAQKGLIFRVREDGKPLSRAVQFLIGIYEFQLKNLDAEFSQLFEEYLPYYGMAMSGLKTGQLRRIPLGSVVKVTRGVVPYNDVRELIKNKDFISVQQCICRKEQGLLGKECSYPQEVCIGFGEFARFYRP
jgi:electron transport complex protein RnfB